MDKGFCNISATGPRLEPSTIAICGRLLPSFRFKKEAASFTELSRSGEVLRTEGTGQKLAQAKSPPRFTRSVAEENGHIVGAELPEFLTAAAARGNEPVARRDDGDLD